MIVYWARRQTTSALKMQADAYQQWLAFPQLSGGG